MLLLTCYQLPPILGFWPQSSWKENKQRHHVKQHGRLRGTLAARPCLWGTSQTSCAPLTLHIDTSDSAYIYIYTKYNEFHWIHDRSQLAHCLHSRSSVHHKRCAPHGPAAVATGVPAVKYQKQCTCEIVLIFVCSLLFSNKTNANPFSLAPTWRKRQLGNWSLICRWWSPHPLPKSLNSEVTTAPQSVSDRYFTGTILNDMFNSSDQLAQTPALRSWHPGQIYAPVAFPGS